MGRGTLFVVSGPSGVGKGTLIKALIEIEDKITYSVSATTRPPRPGEKDGDDYFFLSEKDFIKCIEEGKFLEWAQVHGHYYGTPEEFVEKCLTSGAHVLLEIDTQGARKVKEKRPDAVFIFIEPPSMEALESRLQHRGTDSKGSMELRMYNAKKEMEEVFWYDYRVVNDLVSDAVMELRSILEKEGGGRHCGMKED